MCARDRSVRAHEAFLCVPVGMPRAYRLAGLASVQVRPTCHYCSCLCLKYSITEYPSTAKVWQTLNVGKDPDFPTI